jgi:MFS family permease
MALGALFWGWISDRLRLRKKVAITGTALYASTTLLLLFVPWTPGTFALTLFALLGFSGGSFMITYPCAKEVCPPALSGMAISVVNTGLFLGAALMQALFGWVLDLGWDGSMNGALRAYSLDDYRHGLWLMEGFALVGFVASLWLTETHSRQRVA